MTPSIVIDTADPSILLAGSQWGRGYSINAFGYSATTWNSDGLDLSKPSVLTYTFNGVALNAFGTATSNARFSYSLDGAEVEVGLLDSPTTPNHLWELAGLSAAQHKVEIIPTRGNFSFDYFLVAPSVSTPLNNVDLLYDDSDPALTYSGHWTMSKVPEYAGVYWANNSLHHAWQNGDTFTFTFTGSRIGVYTALNQQAGKLAVSFQLDNNPPSYLSVYNGNQVARPDVWRYNYQLFATDVFPGTHKLTVRLEERTESQVFVMDYIIVKGTEETSLTPPAVANDHTTSSSSSSSHSGKGHLKPAAIAGIAAGSAVVLLLIGAFVVRRFSLIRRRNKTETLKRRLSSKILAIDVQKLTEVKKPASAAAV